MTYKINIPEAALAPVGRAEPVTAPVAAALGPLLAVEAAALPAPEQVNHYNYYFKYIFS